MPHNVQPHRLISVKNVQRKLGWHAVKCCGTRRYSRRLQVKRILTQRCCNQRQQQQAASLSATTTSRQVLLIIEFRTPVIIEIRTSSQLTNLPFLVPPLLPSCIMMMRYSLRASSSAKSSKMARLIQSTKILEERNEELLAVRHVLSPDGLTNAVHTQ